ncbi:MAG: class I SAM-dependent methyltransferase [Deltaproteobacteria bacterium]|nr:class I SAM-dependent methyltransferase [Deltaproteobacteria bacterium]
MSAEVTQAQSKAANRTFYDLVSDVYEEADGRRDERLGRYLDRQLGRVASACGAGRVLDLGCGTGFVASRAVRLFHQVDGVDISPKVLEKARASVPGATFHTAEADGLPFESGSFDAVVAVAFLHHVADHTPVFREIHRVLRPGGMLYTDHDLDRLFFLVFRGPLAVYRLLRNEEKRYRALCPALPSDIYRATEVHHDGVDATGMVRALRVLQFQSVRASYHWMGLSPWFDRIGRVVNDEGTARRGFAPSLTLWAQK